MNGTTGSARTGGDSALLTRTFHILDTLMMNDDNKTCTPKLHEVN